MATIYVDFTKSTGTLTGTWTFTNAGTSVTAAGDGDAVNELANGDYIRQSDGTQWYKVTDRPDADTITITPAFQQATHTDDASASLYNSETGAGTATAFAHLNQATTDEARTAGDTIYVRANQTHTYAGVDITFDEDGDVDNYITLQGCNTVTDPWSDASGVRAILDFGSTSNQVNLTTDQFWKIASLDFKESHDTNGALFLNAAYGSVVSDCRFYDNTSTGVRIISSANVLFEDCLFDNNSIYGINSSSMIYVDGCTFNGDGDNAIGTTAQSMDYGIQVYGGILYIKNSVFGSDTNGDLDLADIRMLYGSVVHGRNVKLDSSTEVSWAGQTDVINLEDDEQTHVAFRSLNRHGTVSRSVVVERSGAGGTAWSILGEPNSNCGLNTPLYLVGSWLRGIPIYLDGTSQTITLYAYATSWAALPSVSEFVVEIEHYEGAADWDIDATADTFAANDQWESFAITLTPSAAGPAYLRVYLKDYEDGTEKIYVDPTPVIS
jgi:hypothetical protein